ncbi:MAG: YdcF family protein [Burkholderiaceae bacterium]
MDVLLDVETQFWLKKFIWLFLLPPNVLLTFATLGVALAAWREDNHRRPAVISLVCLLVFAFLMTPAVSQALMLWVERGAGQPITQDSARELLKTPRPPEAIVILGGGILADERELPKPSMLSGHTLKRVVHGARIAGWTDLSVLVSGGLLRPSDEAEATVMARVLTEQFSQPVRWIEDQSLNTDMNARLSATMLAEVGIEHVILVTEAFHMRRARRAFEQAGLTVTPAPHNYLGGVGRPLSTTWMPTSESASRTRLALHEIIGRWWYQVSDWAAKIKAELA